ncbi:thioredoxin family protein [Evansella tamaricis]|uniref:Thioredoxin family protein n=1 Tax=Evansella tamaricis TaxID=2069301 RepID=A0ABS6J9C3_9BACI|nr:thioredoxin family protein [Evansella tamaricis]MBU9710281.1 thioredoxin family protein [Evansella tamaricis]
MKTASIMLFIIPLCFILIGCQSQEVKSTHDSIPSFSDEGFHSSPMTFLFSNDERIEDENSYYDALLNFKRRYPDCLDTVKIVSTSEKELAEYYNIMVYPTLIVVDEVGVLIRIEGYKEMPEIVGVLEATLVPEEEAS